MAYHASTLTAYHMTYDRCVNGEPTAEGPSEGALFGQVRREPRLSDKVAEMMLETILSRRLAVGERLPSERELGEQFGVSRTVVREAVRALVAKGVIEVRSGSGLRVAAAARHDLEFHRVIARATHNDLFLVLMDSIGTSLIDIRRENLGSGAALETLDQHARIFERIARHDVDGARAAMSAHLDGVATVWKEQRAARKASQDRPSA